MKPAAPKVNAALAADFGLQKIRVAVQEKTGAYPADASTGGSVVSIVETGPTGDVVNTTTCTTSPTPPASGTTCSDNVTAETPGDTITLTQTGAAANLVADPTPQVVGPCDAAFPPFVQTCLQEDVTFTDNGLPPSAVDDSATTLIAKSDDIDVLANDDPHGAPETISAVTQPGNGTATVEPSAAPATTAAPAARPAQTVLYAPKAGFVGTDTFTYTLSTANGTSTATVRVTVDPPPPTAKDDTAATTSGKPVSIDVTGNDSGNGAKKLTVTSVTDPAHGSVKLDGAQVVYTPAASFAGSDHLSYTVSNGFGTATARITITVTTPPAAPGAAQPDNSNNSLAATGVDSGQLLGLAGGLLVLGAVAIAGGRQRRTRTRHAG